ncbi:hypothetical protein GUJ93_ZPchr0004g39840 [Zizania palustris]|uniref:Protein kinase domain-containing protein n=1 Tax=Zizania palustris TaxID=103762 RepID=A0A8J5VY77_ZIZPA|nr:hypothetical protein GUJ93_ZPchr0004g39840 [Zizania palustris]
MAPPILFHTLAATVLLLLWLCMVIAPPATAAACERSCGGVEIPYPFGLDPDCALPGFNLTCNTSGDGKPYYINVEVLSISVLQAQARMRMDISSACYNESYRNMSYHTWSLDLSDTPYRYSYSGNRFTAIGCETLAYIAVGSPDDSGSSLTTGCVATCGQGGATSLTDGTCSGIGCCQTAIPNGFQYYEIWFDDNFNTTSIYNMSRCSYAALVDTSNFTFFANYSTSSAFYDYYGGQAPIVVDWSIGNKTCNEAQKMPGYACVSSHNIDECKEATKYHCYGKCTNTDGGFHCTCPFGTRGDAYKGPCDRGLAIGICVSLLVALTTLLGIEWIKYKHRIKKQDLMRKRDEYFQLHGGQLLIDMMNIESNVSFKLYTRDEIELATKGFDKMSIIGEGGQGTVHIGYNLDQENNPVAIKKCKGFDENSRTEFTQELLILSRVNHANIVKLLGCCLQFEVPVLVAADSAEALAYLHLLDHPILHGDVKSANILLSTNFIAKISDFGCSKIRAVNENDNMVKGTIGYLDPEYLLKFELTDKSDVYSFGVVLLELLTRRKPLSKDKVSLTSVFQEAMTEGYFLELIDKEIMHEDNMGLIRELAVLACQCLVMAGESRPAMSRVAEELRRLERLVQHHHGELPDVSSFTLPASLATDTSEYFTGEENTGRYSTIMSIEFARFRLFFIIRQVPTFD